MIDRPENAAAIPHVNPWLTAVAVMMLAEENKLRQIVVETAAGRVPVMAGAGSNDTRRAMQLSALMEEAGATHLLQIAGSAGDVKDRADLPSLEARDQPAGLFGRDSDKVNVSARSLRHHLGHDRQRAVGPGADDQPGSAPRSSSCSTAT